MYSSKEGKTTNLDPVEFAQRMQAMGEGEIFLTSVDRDGTFEGYDIELIKRITGILSVPVIACGGAGTMGDFSEAVKKGNASALAAGSMFVFYGKHRAVLISYPSIGELETVLA